MSLADLQVKFGERWKIEGGLVPSKVGRKSSVFLIDYDVECTGCDMMMRGFV